MLAATFVDTTDICGQKTDRHGQDQVMSSSPIAVALSQTERIIKCKSSIKCKILKNFN